MSNKSIIAVIVAVVVLFAGGLYWYNSQQNKEYSGSADDSKPAAQSETPTGASGQQANSQQKQPQATSSAPSTSNPTSMNECKRNFDSEKLKTAKVEIKNRIVEIDVKDFGKIQVQLYDQDAPKTVENFLRLTNAGYYDCITFHRVAKGFVIQGGDPTGTGSGGDSAFGGPFADELNPETPSYKAGYQKGVLAMANAGPNTNTSQFFIMLSEVPLPNNYTIFGKVVSGLNVVDKIGQVDITPVMGPTDGAPKTPVVMQSVKIVK